MEAARVCSEKYMSQREMEAARVCIHFNLYLYN